MLTAELTECPLFSALYIGLQPILIGYHNSISAQQIAQYDHEIWPFDKFQNMFAAASFFLGHLHLLPGKRRN